MAHWERCFKHTVNILRNFIKWKVLAIVLCNSAAVTETQRLIVILSIAFMIWCLNTRNNSIQQILDLKQNVILHSSISF